MKMISILLAMERNRGKDVRVFNHTVSRSIKKKKYAKFRHFLIMGGGCGEFGLNALSSNIIATLTLSGSLR